MALHGDIRINGSLIGVWTARRLVKHVLDAHAKHPYECQVAWVDQATNSEPLTFRLDHCYSDGATALAAKVLTRAAGFAPVGVPAPPAAPGERS